MGSQVEQWTSLQGGISGAGQDALDAGFQWVSDVASHGFAHIGQAFVAVFVLHIALRNDAWRGVVAWVFLAFMLMKDFSFGAALDFRLALGAACYLFPWWACRRMARRTGSYTRSALLSWIRSGEAPHYKYTGVDQ